MLIRRVRTDGLVDPCIPSRALKPPSGPGWVHEIKHDGYRLIVRRDGPTVRLFTRRGHDWTDRYPAITGAAGKLRARSFTIDGEAVVVGADGAGWQSTTSTPKDGAVVFRQACKMGLEGIISKRLTAPYRSGPSRDWLKVKNPDSPAMRRHPRIKLGR